MHWRSFRAITYNFLCSAIFGATFLIYIGRFSSDKGLKCSTSRWQSNWQFVQIPFSIWKRPYKPHNFNLIYIINNKQTDVILIQTSRRNLLLVRERYSSKQFRLQKRSSKNWGALEYLLLQSRINQNLIQCLPTREKMNQTHLQGAWHSLQSGSPMLDQPCV